METTNLLKVLIVAAEVAPFAKVGGMADVAGALPKALKQLGHDVRIAMPKYATIDDGRFGLAAVPVRFNVPMGAEAEPAMIMEARLDSSVPVYFVANEANFGREKIYGYADDQKRFIFFSRAVLEMLKALDWQPDVIHANDWHTGIIPNYLRTVYAGDEFFKNTASVFTIHNLAYQGIGSANLLHIAGLDKWGTICPEIPDQANLVNLMARGICYADAVNTVSERYAQEMLTPEYGERLEKLLQSRKDRLFGILNGIDVTVFNPETDVSIAVNYCADCLERRVENKLDLQRTVALPENADVPVIGMVSRLAEQKGFDLLEKVIAPLLRHFGAQLVLLGTGEPLYEESFRRLAADLPEQAAVLIKFDAVLAQKIYAGSDVFLMPSKFEPCGLGQMIAMRYGSVPVVRKTGGLADTVRDFAPASRTGNGFVFEEYNPTMLLAAAARALESYKYKESWQDLMRRDMQADYSWDSSARKYADLYGRAAAFRSLERNT